MNIPNIFKKKELTPEEKDMEEKYKHQETILRDLNNFRWWDNETEDQLEMMVAEPPYHKSTEQQIISWCMQALEDSIIVKTRAYITTCILDGPPYRFVVKIGVYHLSSFYPGDVKYTVALHDAFDDHIMVMSSASDTMPKGRLYSGLDAQNIRNFVDHSNILGIMLNQMMDRMMDEYGMDFRKLIP